MGSRIAILEIVFNVMEFDFNMLEVIVNVLKFVVFIVQSNSNTYYSEVAYKQ
jgi:hypothetical protein